jgi:hypothetical protein
MLAGPSSTLATMAQAISTTMNALDAASELDLDRSDEDRKFFAARKALLAPYKAQLVTARRVIEDHDLDVGGRLQVRVEIGDQVLDRGVGDGNTRTKLALKGKPGLEASHVFGKNVATLTKERIALEPQKVLDAVDRFKDVPEFPERATIAADLTSRADQQQGLGRVRSSRRDRSGVRRFRAKDAEDAETWSPRFLAGARARYFKRGEREARKRSDDVFAYFASFAREIRSALLPTASERVIATPRARLAICREDGLS